MSKFKCGHEISNLNSFGVCACMSFCSMHVDVYMRAYTPYVTSCYLKLQNFQVGAANGKGTTQNQYVYTCTRVYMYVYMYVCMYVYTHVCRNCICSLCTVL